MITGNTAESQGGGVFSDKATPSFTNCTISGNGANQGDGVYFGTSGNPITTFTNCIIWGNGKIVNDSGVSSGAMAYTYNSFFSFSNIEESGGSDGWNEKYFGLSGGNMDNGYLRGNGGNNIDTDPLFVNASAGDYRLIEGSPSIDAGNNDARVGDLYNSEIPYHQQLGTYGLGLIIEETLDLDGEERIQDNDDTPGDVIDMGPFEGGEPRPHYFVNHLAVDSGEDDPDRGKEWGKAFQSLETVIELNTVCDIWVAKGSYSSSTFNIKNGMRVYGGFAGNEERLEERNWVDNKTTLTTPGSPDYLPVVTFSSVSEATVLDGFTITGGIARKVRKPGTYIYSGGNGGGISITNGSPQIANCTITGNSAQEYGGGISNIADIENAVSNPTFTNCTITGNGYDITSAYISKWGGGISNLAGNTTDPHARFTQANPTFINCTITGNISKTNGGGIYNESKTGGTANFTLINCTISGNRSNAGIYNKAMRGFGSDWENNAHDYPQSTSNITCTNCIVWGNKTQSGADDNHRNDSHGTSEYSHSITSEAGTNNINDDPRFVRWIDPAKAPTSRGDYHLTNESPAIDAGNNDAIKESLDLDGEERIQDNDDIPGGVVDMGAYEGGEEPPEPRNYKVNAVADPGGDGLEWESAFNNLADAIKAAYVSDQIWVMKGTYYPDEGCSDNNSACTFDIPEGVKVYGGFAGTEDNLVDRDWEENETILSGDIDGNDQDLNIEGTNARHVVTFNGVSEATLLDGFTITAGNAEGPVSGMKDGGGIYNIDGSPQIANCTITGNSASSMGGGMFNSTSYNVRGVFANPTLTNCTISSNKAPKGAGMYNQSNKGTEGASPILTNCTISGNFSSYWGGGVYHESNSGQSKIEFINCTITGNVATHKGGGVLLSARYATITPVFTNCTISGNKGGGIVTYQYKRNSYITPTFTNSIVWGNFPDGEQISSEGSRNTKGIMTNPIFSHSNIQNYAGLPAGNIGINPEDNPQFVTPLVESEEPSVGGDFHLQEESPAINAGDNSVWAEQPGAEDIEGNSRISDDVVDMGAYESKYKDDVDAPVMVNVCPDNMEKCPKGSKEFWEISNLELTLNEKVNWGTGTIVLKKVDGDEFVEGFELPVEGPGGIRKEYNMEDGHTLITIDPENKLLANTEYTVVIPEGAFVDLAVSSNSFAGLPYTDAEGAEISWRFIIDQEPPTVTFDPADESSGNNVATNIKLNFDDVVL